MPRPIWAHSETFGDSPMVVKRIMSDRPILLEATAGRVVVRAGGQTVADTRRALAMREMDYPVVQYVPRGDVDMSLLERTTHSSY